ncbi:hypothetical protein [Pontibacillus chungwhensis]|nr:hypothetical protein [Pontibacillus chungwhensis]
MEVSGFKKWMCILFIVVTLVVGGCRSTEEEIIYEGKSEHWKIQYISALTERGRESKVTIEFIGSSEPSQTFYYDVGRFSGSAPYNGDQVVIGPGICEHCEVLVQEEEKVGHIKWENTSEEIKLTLR